MNRIKPFRLINRSELSLLQHRLTQNLNQWNEQYSCIPITGELSLYIPPEKKTTIGRMIRQNNQALAMIIHPEDSFMPYCLFGDNDPCFHDISHSFFLTFMSMLLEATPIESPRQEEPIHWGDWFYTGSPALQLTLKLNHLTLSLYLHPQFVLNRLFQRESKHPPLSSIGDAIDAQTITLHIELHPQQLQLNDMLRWRVGDVIKTKHGLNTALQLNHEHNPICDVDIGQTHSMKSIQIQEKIGS